MNLFYETILASRLGGQHPIHLIIMTALMAALQGLLNPAPWRDVLLTSAGLRAPASAATNGGPLIPPVLPEVPTSTPQPASAQRRAEDPAHQPDVETARTADPASDAIRGIGHPSSSDDTGFGSAVPTVGKALSPCDGLPAIVPLAHQHPIPASPNSCDSWDILPNSTSPIADSAAGVVVGVAMPNLTAASVAELTASQTAQPPPRPSAPPADWSNQLTENPAAPPHAGASSILQASFADLADLSGVDRRSVPRTENSDI